MLVNKKHFADAGITEMPKTLDELVAAAKEIKEKGIVEYPIGLPLSPTEGASTSWYLLTKAFGGDLFDKDFNPLFTTPDSAGYKAMAFEAAAAEGRAGRSGVDRPARTARSTTSMFAKGLTSIMISGEPGRLGQMNDPAQSQVAGQVEAILVPTASGDDPQLRPARGAGHSEGLAEQGGGDRLRQMVHQQGVPDRRTTVNGVLPTRTSALAELNEAGKLNSGDALVGAVEDRRAAVPAGHADLVSAVLERA